jgi:hypothetical protein
MALAVRLRVAFLLLVAAALVVSGSWLATSTGSAHPQTHRGGELIKYHGTEARAVLPLGDDRLPGAPASFRAFVKKTLQHDWDLLGHYARCRTATLITVHAIRTDGFAIGSETTRPRGPHCSAGGGAAEIWAVRKGEWKAVIGSQDYWPCDRLEKFGIPSEIGVHECYDGEQTVPYDHP